MMTKCESCGSYAINHHAHGRDGSDGHLCDVCYWRMRAEQPVALEPLTREQIREVFLAHGFTIKEGLTDLKPYVYDAAYALLDRAKAKEGQSHD